MSTAAYSAAMPEVSATFGSAPLSIRTAARSKCRLMIADTRALVPLGSVRFRSAPASASARVALIAPCREAYISAVHPPLGRMVVRATMPSPNLNFGKVVLSDWALMSAPRATSALIASA